METYIKNRNCPCVRCRMNYMFWPVMLVTLGIMFLLNNLYVARDSMTLAVLLIAIGAVKLLQSSATTEGHIQPPVVYVAPTSVAAPPVQPSTPDSGVQHG